MDKTATRTVLFLVMFLALINITSQAAIDNENETKTDKADIEKVQENKKKLVENLVKQKAKLFELINNGIDDSVNALNSIKDTESGLGVRFMKELKDQMKEINGTELKLEDAEIQRRIYSDKAAKDLQKPKLKFSLNEIASLFNIKGKGDADVQAKNDLEIKAKLEAWIQQRREEKSKIKSYQKGTTKRTTIKPEKCEREGEGTKSKRIAEIKRNEYHPCCRKCCKRSYMGCL